jgi:hypothetical protein
MTFSPGVGGEDVSLTFMHGGIECSYVLHLPSAYDCKTPLPVVIGLHGYTGTGKGFENQTIKIFEHVNENGYIGVFPDGLSASPSQAWATGFNGRSIGCSCTITWLPDQRVCQWPCNQTALSAGLGLFPETPKDGLTPKKQ